MPKSILAVLFVLTPLLASAEAQTGNPFLKNDAFPSAYFLIPNAMPHFMGVYLKGGGMQKIDPSEEQRALIEGRHKEMVSVIMPTATEIKEIEARIAHQVIYEGKTVQDLQAELDQVANLRRKLTDLQIECLVFFKEVLTPVQYEQIVELAQQWQP